jgi:uncharacterized protein (TIGR00730 family)
MTKIQNIAIFGGAECETGSELYKDVFEVAKMLAHHGYVTVNGGGPGVMLAATEGAESVGGKTLAVTFDPKNAPGFEGRYIKNKVDTIIKTHNYIERMFTLMEHGDCYVIFNGGTGTISEFGTAWCLARLYYGRHKPFILYGHFWHEVIGAITKNMMMRENDLNVFKIVSDPEAVLRAIHEFDNEFEGLAFPKVSADEQAFMR